MWMKLIAKDWKTFGRFQYVHLIIWHRYFAQISMSSVLFNIVMDMWIAHKLPWVRVFSGNVITEYSSNYCCRWCYSNYKQYDRHIIISIETSEAFISHLYSISWRYECINCSYYLDLTRISIDAKVCVCVSVREREKRAKKNHQMSIIISVVSTLIMQIYHNSIYSSHRALDFQFQSVNMHTNNQ